MFDILSNNQGWDASLLMTFDEDAPQGKYVLDQMVDIGVESSNSVSILGTTFFILMLYLLQILIFALFKVLGYKYTGKVGEYLHRLVSKLFFAYILAVGIGTYIGLCIAGYLQMHL